jgi:hypothetical protein
MSGQRRRLAPDFRRYARIQWGLRICSGVRHAQFRVSLAIGTTQGLDTVDSGRSGPCHGPGALRTGLHAQLGRRQQQRSAAADAKADTFEQEVALLREELRIKDGRLNRIPPQRRPYYTAAGHPGVACLPWLVVGPDRQSLRCDHGLPSSSRRFEPLLTRLSDRYHLVARLPGLRSQRLAQIRGFRLHVLPHRHGDRPLRMGRNACR